LDGFIAILRAAPAGIGYYGRSPYEQRKMFPFPGGAPVAVIDFKVWSSILDQLFAY
jgi:hypothetical protein